MHNSYRSAISISISRERAEGPVEFQYFTVNTKTNDSQHGLGATINVTLLPDRR